MHVSNTKTGDTTMNDKNTIHGKNNDYNNRHSSNSNCDTRLGLTRRGKPLTH